MLNTEQITQYGRDGFTVYRQLVHNNTVSALMKEIDDITSGNTASNYDSEIMEMEPNQDPDGTLVRRIYDPCTRYKPFVDISENDDVLDCVEQLIGSNLVFNQSKINMKSSQGGSAVEWHQDMAYGLLTNRDNLALLLYLDDADRNNGCLQVIPGQHQIGLLDHSHRGTFQGRVTEKVETEKAISIEGEAGTVIFLHCMTPHSSLPNLSSRPRRTLIWGYRSAEAYPVELGNDGLVNVDKIVRGKKSRCVRFEDMNLQAPAYPKPGLSLYELQEQSHN